MAASLEVDGTISNTSSVTVNSGATLTGIGIVNSTVSDDQFRRHVRARFG